MADIRIVPYTEEDNEAALGLEELCVQGESVALRYVRPSFHARSEVYHKYRILCAKVGEKLVGIGAWSEKQVRLHGQVIKAVYFYDLRVHPAYRKQGVSVLLIQAAYDEIGDSAECAYTLIAGENERSLDIIRRIHGFYSEIPLTYACIPVYRKLNVEEDFRETTASDVHRLYLRLNPDVQFVPEFAEERLLGHVRSLSLRRGGGGGVSIWTNENLLAEQIVDIPGKYRVMGALGRALGPVIKLPAFPRRGEIVKSWFLFDLSAKDAADLRNILRAANNLAYEEEKKFIYVLLQTGENTLRSIRSSGLRVYTIPYYFLAKGRVVPAEGERIYIDIRDL